MKVTINDPPREYTCGFEIKRQIKDCAQLELQPDEQVSFVSAEGAEYDVTRKNFGYYATPSINGRLAHFGFRCALAKNRLAQIFIILVEPAKEAEFNQYLHEEKMSVLLWLDSEIEIQKLLAKINHESE